MTVMIDSFFGVHPFVVRSGVWGQMKPGEKDLYIYLLEESERRCTRKLVVTDAQIRNGVRTASRTLCNARKKLQERGLISCRPVVGNRYEYVICDPKTGKPYPGLPTDPIVVPKRSRSKTSAYTPPPVVAVATERWSQEKASENEPLEKHGVAGIFRKTRRRALGRPQGQTNFRRREPVRHGAKLKGKGVRSFH